MNIVVAMKQIPDLQQVRIRNREPVFDDVPLTFGDIDKNALEAAVLIKEATDAKVIVASIGNEELEDTVKEALAAGADEAMLLLDDDLAGIESAQSAVFLAETIKKIDEADVIIFGEGSGDNYSGQVGSRVAEILGYAQVGYASSIELNGNSARITRSLEDCEEVVEVDLPVVVSVVAGINEPRIPSVTQILKAGKKPKEILELDDLEVDMAEKTIDTISNLAPESERKRVEVKSVSELVKALETEGLLRR